MTTPRLLPQLLLLLLLLGAKAQQYPQPEQVHLSVTNDPTEMVVTWVTQSPTNESLVEFGTWRLTQRASGQQKTFTDGGQAKRQLFMHRAVLRGLQSGQRYLYHVGGDAGWSDIFFFNATKASTNWTVRLAAYGDMGNENVQALPFLQKAAQAGDIDLVLHVGDFAYDMYVNDAKVGDEFMRQVEPVAAYVPYMTCAGNHENAYNFSNYRSRFTMPGGDGEGNFFSFDYGPLHIVSFNSEFYYYLQYGWKQAVYQYQWLEADLKRANLPENRAARPWIVAMAHRPMYCSNSNDPEHCTNQQNIIRTGFPVSSAHRRFFGSDFILGPEDLFYRYGVDLVLGAHEHSYERFWPVYDRRVCNASNPKNPYDNPPAPVHIVTGSAGCREGVDPFIPAGLSWSAFRSDDYGYTRITVANSSHLLLEQLSASKGGRVIDSITYVRTAHGPQQFGCN